MSLSRSPKNLPDNPPPAIHRIPDLAGAVRVRRFSAENRRRRTWRRFQMERCQIGGAARVHLSVEAGRCNVYAHISMHPNCKPWITHPETWNSKDISQFDIAISDLSTNFPPSRSPFSPKSCLFIFGSASLHEVSSGRLCLTLCLEVYCRLYYSISLM